MSVKERIVAINLINKAFERPDYFNEIEVETKMLIADKAQEDEEESEEVGNHASLCNLRFRNV